MKLYNCEIVNTLGYLLAILFLIFFFFNDTATTEIYTLSLHDALPIYLCAWLVSRDKKYFLTVSFNASGRSEEHTSELQSRLHLVCRLLLEKKKKKNIKLENNKYKRLLPRTIKLNHLTCTIYPATVTTI